MTIKTLIRKQIEKSSVLSHLVFPLSNFFHCVKNLIRYGVADPRVYFIFNGKRLVYLINSKVAQTTITNTNGNKVKKEYFSVDTGTKARRLSKEEEGYYKFTFVRNPFERLYSCYRSKIKADKQKFNKKYGDFDFYLFGYLKKDRSFENFVDRVLKVPYWLADRHFKPQAYLIYKDNQLPLDFIGRLENIKEEFEPIRNRFDLDQLPHLNDSSMGEDDWRDAYTKSVVTKVARYYRQDLELWYPNAKDDLLEYLENKSAPKL